VKSVAKLHHGLKPATIRPPWHTTQMDFLIMPTTTKNGNKYLLSFVNLESGGVKLQPTKTRSGLEVADAFLKRVILQGNTPKILHSDNGKEFVEGAIK
jgi:hypothetical protein